MEIKIFILLFPVLIWLDSVSLRDSPFNQFILDCQSNPKGMPLELKLLKGVWHEVARFPKSYAVRCLSVECPESASPDLNIKLSYVSHIGQKAKRVEDTVTFPMDNLTKNSIFQTEYEMRDMKTFLRYVIVYTDYVNVSLVCGSSPITPFAMIKIFSRNETLDSNMKDFVNQQLKKTPLKRGFMWLDNSNCDRANCAFVSSRIIQTLTIAFSLLNIYII
ncbi:uncharacterized protein LOC26528416 [Drosophila mojavensis]|uniref:Lipocalin/cytosolic fatty-acid binding domain-containing protein n=1 Tax=Drosophila mojavensis TaxID=7230 RepID=A0A0Q9XDC9_DROMO|nr:uncharacterized protein LOC26528416 [Drosophila mojavensis]KRG01731.1 uncharacterized protein Dmoj_GI26775 [Drosophila mojavensis]